MRSSQSASDVLKAHARERYLRTAIKSIDHEQDPSSAVPRMSAEAWIESCLLTRGVDQVTLDMLGAHSCENAGWHWDKVAVVIQGVTQEVLKERAPVPLTLRQAAARAGLACTYAEARARQLQALSVVQENMFRRATRHEQEGIL